MLGLDGDVAKAVKIRNSASNNNSLKDDEHSHRLGRKRHHCVIGDGFYVATGFHRGFVFVAGLDADRAHTLTTPCFRSRVQQPTVTMSDERVLALETEVATLRRALQNQTEILKTIAAAVQQGLNAIPQNAQQPALPKPLGARRASDSLKEMLTGTIKHANFRDFYSADPSKVLGTGMTGSVFVVKHKVTKKKFACKKIAKAGMNQAKIDNLRKEVNIMAMLDHPNIIKLVDAFEDRKYLVIISELCSGGELYDHLISAETYTQQVAANVFKQMVKAVNFCHQNGIAHRDLKLENFIITGSCPCLYCARAPIMPSFLAADDRLVCVGFVVLQTTLRLRLVGNTAPEAHRFRIKLAAKGDGYSHGREGHHSHEDHRRNGLLHFP